MLGKLPSVSISQKRGSVVSKKGILLFNKFVKQGSKIYKNLPNLSEWQSFYVHDLPIIVDISEDVRNVSIRNGLNRSQTKALETTHG
jgi:hypothetical protein